jgi:polysaccharide deacetylase 2 family uncharacterized protein YibQ
VSAAPANNQPPAGTLPPRRETFLAKYPRKLKLGVLAALVAVLFLWVHGGGSNRSAEASKEDKEINSTVSGADSPAAVANPPPVAEAPAAKEKPDTTEISSAASNATVENAVSEAEESGGLFMKPAPDPALSEDTGQGSLPRISDDGRQPWQVYARPFNGNDKRPRVAVVITDLGLKRVASDAAIARMPPNVTLAFDVESPVLGAWCARARQAGHETLLMLPMEPFDYPRSDPGPNTLLSNIPPGDNMQRLRWALMQASGYVGVTTLSGTRFTTDPSQITPVLDVLRSRGLMVFDARVAPHSAIADLAHDAHVPVAVDSQRLDQNLSPVAIDEALSQIEQTARLTGRAIVMAPSLPIILDHLEPWIKQLPRKGIALAPLSAMVQ